MVSEYSLRLSVQIQRKPQLQDSSCFTSHSRWVFAKSWTWIQDLQTLRQSLSYWTLELCRDKLADYLQAVCASTHQWSHSSSSGMPLIKLSFHGRMRGYSIRDCPSFLCRHEIPDLLRKEPCCSGMREGNWPKGEPAWSLSPLQRLIIILFIVGKVNMELTLAIL